MEERKSTEEFYFALVKCENCRSELDVSILSGTKVKTHLRLKSVLCDNCGFRL